MATYYATRSDVDAYLTDGSLPAGAEGDKLLERAERDVDNLLGPLPFNTTTGLHYNPADLQDWEAEALKRAVCAQAEWRLKQGDALLEPTRKLIQGPAFRVEYADAALKSSGRIGPNVKAELSAIPHLRARFARVRV